METAYGAFYQTFMIMAMFTGDDDIDITSDAKCDTNL